ncbi:unnamed protein product, partial [Mycena citricolor]
RLSVPASYPTASISHLYDTQWNFTSPMARSGASIQMAATSWLSRPNAGSLSSTQHMTMSVIKASMRPAPSLPSDSGGHTWPMTSLGTSGPAIYVSRGRFGKSPYRQRLQFR